MSLRFNYIPLTFLKNEEQIKEQIKNTVILSYFHSLNPGTIKLNKLIEGTQYGYNASAKESGNNHFLRISDITDGNVNWSTVPYCDCQSEAAYLLQRGDLLIARTGGTTGKSFLIKNPPEKAIYAGYLIRIRANKGSNREFLNLFLNSYAYWSQVVSLNRGEFRPSVNASKLKNLLLPDCNIQQQADAVNISKGKIPKGYQILEQKIQKTLNEYDNCINLQKKIITQGKDIQLLKQAILQEAIQGKLTEDWRKKNPELISGGNSAEKLLQEIKAQKAQLIKEKKLRKEKALPRLSENKIPFNLPEGWIWCNLLEISDKIHYGLTTSAIKKQEGVRLLRITDIQENKVDWKSVPGCKHSEDDLRKFMLRDNDIVIARTGGTIGKSYLVKGISVKSLFASYLIRLIPSKLINSKYIKYYLESPCYWQGLYDLSRGDQPNVSASKLKSLKFPLPSLEEQETIIAKVEGLLKKYDAIKREIEKSEQHAEMLMQAVLKEAFENKPTQKEVLEV